MWQELRDCQKDKETSGLEVRVEDEANLMHWKGTLKGPKGTPYEGGIFKIDIQLPADYPFVPPKVSSAEPPAQPGSLRCARHAQRGPASASVAAPP